MGCIYFPEIHPYVHLALVFLCTCSATVQNQKFHEDQKTVQISSKTHSIIYTRQPFIFFKRLFFERGQFWHTTLWKKESQLSISLSFKNYASTENLSFLNKCTSAQNRQKLVVNPTLLHSSHVQSTQNQLQKHALCRSKVSSKTSAHPLTCPT